MPTLPLQGIAFAAVLLLLTGAAIARPAGREEAMPIPFQPYENESDVVGIGPGLTVENRLDRVTIIGDVDLTLDREGAEKAEALRALLDRICGELRAREPLPPQVATSPPAAVDNPFD